MDILNLYEHTYINLKLYRFNFKTKKTEVNFFSELL